MSKIFKAIRTANRVLDAVEKATKKVNSIRSKAGLIGGAYMGAKNFSQRKKRKKGANKRRR